MSNPSERQRRINLKVSDELHARLRHAAIRHRKSLIELVAVWLEEKAAEDEGAVRLEANVARLSRLESPPAPAAAEEEPQP